MSMLILYKELMCDPQNAFVQLFEFVRFSPTWPIHCTGLRLMTLRRMFSGLITTQVVQGGRAVGIYPFWKGWGGALQGKIILCLLHWGHMDNE